MDADTVTAKNSRDEILSSFASGGYDILLGKMCIRDRGIRHTANWDGFDMDYEFKIFDNPCEMREALREKNLVNNKARILAGYCYEWRTQKLNDMEAVSYTHLDVYKRQQSY